MYLAQSSGLSPSGTGQRLSSKGESDNIVVSMLDAMMMAQKTKNATV